jgi:hypothetical protein
MSHEIVVPANAVLDDPTLLIGENHINGRWCSAAPGKSSSVTGQCNVLC